MVAQSTSLVGVTRPQLAPLAGQRITVEGLCLRIKGCGSAVNGRYRVLVKQVREASTGLLLADHIWLNVPKPWVQASIWLKTIRFEATVKLYHRRTRTSWDYGLVQPSPAELLA